jgi:hypothetical protein
MAVDAGSVRLRVEAETPVSDAMALAGAAGRLYQAVTASTVAQFSDAEVRAWVVFADALKRIGVVRGFDYGAGFAAVETADSLDAHRLLADPED